MIETPIDKTPEQLRKESADIAKLLFSTKTELRGNLLLMVADRLRDYGQSYTATLIQMAGRTYNSEK